MAARPTRRQLLAGGLGAAAAGLTASTAQALPSPHAESDGSLLRQLVGDSQMVQYGCQKSLASGKLHQDSRRVLRLLLAHERAHLAALRSRLRALRLPTSAPQALRSDVVSLFKEIKDEVVALQGMVQVGNLAQHDYWSAAGSFQDPVLARLAAEILASEAQHWTVIVALLHRGDPIQAVPNPATRGAEQISAPHTEVGAPS